MFLRNKMYLRSLLIIRSILSMKRKSCWSSHCHIESRLLGSLWQVWGEWIKIRLIKELRRQEIYFFMRSTHVVYIDCLCLNLRILALNCSSRMASLVTRYWCKRLRWHACSSIINRWDQHSILVFFHYVLVLSPSVIWIFSLLYWYVYKKRVFLTLSEFFRFFLPSLA